MHTSCAVSIETPSLIKVNGDLFAISARIDVNASLLTDMPESFRDAAICSKFVDRAAVKRIMHGVALGNV